MNELLDKWMILYKFFVFLANQLLNIETIKKYETITSSLLFIYGSNGQINNSLILITLHEVIDKICIEKGLYYSGNKGSVL